ncbi:MAG: hypothetical protein ACYCO0_04760 [Candidatus Micrarchaeaceae archaeon]
MYTIPKFNPDPVAVLARKDSGPEEVIAKARDLSKGKEFALILNPSSGIEDRLLPSYINAEIRRGDNNMRSGSLALEIMLFVSGTMNIGNAIERSSARGNEFIIFSSSPKLLDSLVSKFRLKVVKRYELKLYPEKSSRIAIIPIKDDKQQ